MEKTLNEIAEYLQGRIIGDPQVAISNLRGIDEAKDGDLTFIANPKYRDRLLTTRASAILVAPGTECPGKNLLLVDDPYTSFGRLLQLFYAEEQPFNGISEQACIDDDAVISPDAVVYPQVYIGARARIDRNVVLYPGVFIGPDVRIDEGSVLYPNVVVYRRCIIGKRVILHAGVIVGADGFGFALPGQENVKMLQVGFVQIDDDVEIGANTTIDRGTLDRTWIQKGAKIDNLVQIAHNVVIGEKSIIVSQVGISGSTKIGKGVIIGGQAGLVGHISIGDGTMVAARTGVSEDVPPGQIISGSPHMPHREWLRMIATMPKLPEMRRTVTSLTKRIEELEKTLKETSA
ncbi:MAG: UDP-3-O-(3-hydroxymyristoyl)glucosamine N-acyltransferase [Syntrophales bacterium]|nr:UDP-3-O-(3-hydroxymyristoyl)glucosamine N-acyltransferase [Syntrophales bacterium]